MRVFICIFIQHSRAIFTFDGKETAGQQLELIKFHIFSSCTANLHLWIHYWKVFISNITKNIILNMLQKCERCISHSYFFITFILCYLYDND